MKIKNPKNKTAELLNLLFQRARDLQSMLEKLMSQLSFIATAF